MGRLVCENCRQSKSISYIFKLHILTNNLYNYLIIFVVVVSVGHGVRVLQKSWSGIGGVQ